ncbi:MAG: VOC family protein [Deltaproteobacteria bacterium]|nr:VOC family protein [Deltaproteobacteria bacterium]
MKATYKGMLAFVWVTDMEKALRFYLDVLGFSRVYENAGWIELAAPGIKTAYLALNRWGQRTKPPKNEFVTLRVDDLEAFHVHLIEHGVRMKGGIEEYVDEGQGMRMFKFYDPDDNILTASAVENAQ